MLRSRLPRALLRARSLQTGVLAGAMVACCTVGGHAQVIGSAIRQVGGVWINPQGLLRNIQADETDQLRAQREQALEPLAGGLDEPCPLRKISLRRLEAAIAEQLASGKPLSDDVKYLAGLQQIVYIFVYPEEHDIVLAGPGDGWKVGKQGEIVGLANCRPVLLLDDLLVALRAVDFCRETGISCSIDPTDEGLVRLRALVPQLTKHGTDASNIDIATTSIEQTLGAQIISVGGVPAASHFARVLVAADYRMKRLAMGFEPAPIKGLPSFLQMSKAGGRGMRSMLPRWWLEPDYEGLLADENGQAWQIRGAHVKAATEEDFVTQGGAREHSGKANPVAKKWADNMTRRYDELAGKEPIFGQLRGCIDLAIAAALISKEGLLTKADCRLPLLYGEAELPSEKFPAPRQVSSQASVLQKGTNWLISASGGVKLNPWILVEDCKSTAALAPRQVEAKPAGDRWWWN